MSSSSQIKEVINLKKFLLVLVIGLVAAIGMGGTADATTHRIKTAGTCQQQEGAITFTGYLQQSIDIFNCVNVDMIRMFWQAPNGITEGMWDNSLGVYHFAASPPTLASSSCGRQYTAFTGVCSHVIHVGSWCPPQTPRAVAGVSNVQLHTRTPSSWGTVYQVTAQNQTIWC